MGTGYIFIATVVDANGVTSSTFVEETYSTASPDIVEKSDPSWSGMQPVFGEVEYEAGLKASYSRTYLSLSGTGWIHGMLGSSMATPMRPLLRKQSAMHFHRLRNQGMRQ